MENSLDTLGLRDSNGRGHSQDAIAPGSRVRVACGRNFKDFGAGDRGVVVRVDWQSRTCDVAFEGRGSPLTVAARHLEPDSPQSTFRHDSYRAQAMSGSRAALAMVNIPHRGQAESAEGAPLATMGLDLNHDGRADVYLRGVDLNHDGIPDALQPQVLWQSEMMKMVPQPSLEVVHSFAHQDVAYEMALRDQQERYRSEAAEFRRMATVSDHVANGTSAAPTTQGTDDVETARSESQHHGADVQSSSISNVLRGEEEALAAAVQASATATAAARVTGMVEVASLRSAINDLRELVVHEAEQRVAGLQEAQRAIERLRADVELQHSEVHGALRHDIRGELQKFLRDAMRDHSEVVGQRHSELESLCKSIRADSCTEAERRGQEAVEAATQLLEQRLGLVHERLESLMRSSAEGSSELQGHFAAHHATMEKRHGALDLRQTALDEQLKSLSVTHSRHGDQLESLRSQLEVGLEQGMRRLTEMHDKKWSSSSTGFEDKMQSMASRVQDKLEPRVEELHKCHRESLEQWERRFAFLDNRLSSIGQWEHRFDALGSRIDSFAHRGQQPDHRAEAERNTWAGHQRLDSLAARVDALTVDLASKVGREAVPAPGHHEALAARVDNLARQLNEEVSHHEVLSSRVDRLSQQVMEEVARLDGSHELRFAEAMKAGKQTRDMMEAHLSTARDREHSFELICARAEERSRSIDQLSVRLDTVSEALAKEVRNREEAVAHVESQCRQAREAVSHVEGQCRQAREGMTLVESQCRQAREAAMHVESQCRQAQEAMSLLEAQQASDRQLREREASNTPRKAPSVSEGTVVERIFVERGGSGERTSPDLEHQLKAVLSEVREEAEFSRREEAHRRHEAELSLRRLRSELDGLREDIVRREHQVTLPTARQVSWAPIPLAGPMVEEVVRMSSTPLRQRPMQQIISVETAHGHGLSAEADVFRWGSPLRAAQPPSATAIRNSSPAGIASRNAAMVAPMGGKVVPIVDLATGPAPATPLLAGVSPNCSACGELLTGDSQFCRKCGTRRKERIEDLQQFHRASHGQPPDARPASQRGTVEVTPPRPREPSMVSASPPVAPSPPAMTPVPLEVIRRGSC